MNMYSKLKCSVQMDGGISEYFETKVGLKQGCNLSPSLFNLFVNDIVRKLNNLDNAAPQLADNKISCLLYADDLVLLSESKEGLQKSINELYSYTKEWFLEINSKKTKCLTFGRGRKNKEVNQFEFGKQILENCESYCYLGVIFCTSGSMKIASKALYDKAQGAMFSLLRNINNHHACNFKILLELFDKMISPILLYNCEIWGTGCLPKNHKNNDLFDMQVLTKQLPEILQIKFLKMILRVRTNTTSLGVLTETGRYPMIIRL